MNAAGAAIWIQVGLGGLFAMEAGHEPYASRSEPGLCQYSNLGVPAQMLGMKGACYNPAVTRARRST